MDTGNMELLIGALAGVPVREEARGQAAFVASETLPATIEPDGAKEVFERAGVRFLGPVPHDPLFLQVELPAGWRRVASSNAQLSMLVDERGRERARIFYKAASYDRKATLILVSRYGWHERPDDFMESEESFTVVVTDGRQVLDLEDATILFETDVYAPELDMSAEGLRRRMPRYRAWREATEVARAWLDSHFPDWQNPFAYWD